VYSNTIDIFLQTSGVHTAPDVNTQSAVNTEPIKELSTVTEGATILSSCSSPCNTEQAKIDIGENSKNSEGTEILGDEDIPDVMTDMLRRGLITSPLAWTKAFQQSDDETSVSDVLYSGFSPQHEQEKFKQDVLESYVGKGTDSPESFKDRQSIANKKMGFSQQVAETFAKLGKNPSRTDVTNAFKNLGLKWKARGRDQNVNPVISKEGLDPASEEFRQQVLESFVGLGLDSSPEDLQAAFQRLGLECPGGYLCRSDICETKYTHRASVTCTRESARTLRSNIQFYGADSPVSGTVLPPEHPSDPASSDGSLSP
jgi:hypothetical protein